VQSRAAAEARSDLLIDLFLPEGGPEYFDALLAAHPEAHLPFANHSRKEAAPATMGPSEPFTFGAPPVQRADDAARDACKGLMPPS